VGLLSRMLGGRPDAEAVTGDLAAAVGALPGVGGHDLTFTPQPHASGAVSGTVEVADSATFLEVLRTVRRTLDGPLGRRADLVTFYLTGRTPDGASVSPGDLGLVQPPTGREVALRLLA
jgi:hypothetical protein